MTHPRRGYALFINMEKFHDDPKNEQKRIGFQLDGKALDEAFAKLDFTVRNLHDLTKIQLRETITTFSKFDFSDDDCFVCIVMSHGRLGTICTADNQEFPLDDLFTPFEKNVSLKGKPKLFFIQACRGYIHPAAKFGLVQGISSFFQALKKSKQSSAQNPPFNEEPQEIDCLRVYATSQGVTAMRDSKGSLFIQRLCDVLNRSGKTDSIQTIVARVTKNVHDKENEIKISEKKSKIVKIICVSYQTLTGSVLFHHTKLRADLITLPTNFEILELE